VCRGRTLRGGIGMARIGSTDDETCPSWIWAKPHIHRRGQSLPEKPAAWTDDEIHPCSPRALRWTTPARTCLRPRPACCPRRGRWRGLGRGFKRSHSPVFRSRMCLLLAKRLSRCSWPCRQLAGAVLPTLSDGGGSVPPKRRTLGCGFPVLINAGPFLRQLPRYRYNENRAAGSGCTRHGVWEKVTKWAVRIRRRSSTAPIARQYGQGNQWEDLAAS